MFSELFGEVNEMLSLHNVDELEIILEKMDFFQLIKLQEHLEGIVQILPADYIEHTSLKEVLQLVIDIVKDKQK